MKSALQYLAGALLLTSGALARPQELETLEPVTEDFSAAAGNAPGGGPIPPNKWVKRTWNGAEYKCKCYPGDSCWPSTKDWQRLNTTVGGNLQVNLPPAASCYNSFAGPLGTVNPYNAAKCAEVTANFPNEQFQIDLPTAGLWTYFTNDTCRPTTNPADTCTLGHYGVLYIKAQTVAHIQAGINFARDNNLRLIIRNTGHDFLGRSVGWGSLVINTHSFQSISTTNSWTGPGGYTGSAITVGAGVQAITALNHLHALNPPKIMVTGECATVGVAGGLPQGGGHGPLTNQQGFLADTALQFKVITAGGQLTTANANTNPDLFFALRGGGPAAFAVIVEATYKTFTDVPSAGIHVDITPANTNGDINLLWQAIRVFHSYSVAWVDAGLYVYYEIFGPTLHVHPIVGVGKTSAELLALVQPFFNDLTALGVTYTTTSHSYPTFHELYFAQFEAEVAGNSALTGGWTVARQDAIANGTAIVNAFRALGDAGAIMVGHMWNAGAIPQAEQAKSSINPRFRSVVDKIITIVPVAGNAPLSAKAAAQNLLTNVVDAGLRAASPNGAAYINEADPFQPNWQTAFWGTNYPALLTARSKWDPEGVFYAVSTPGTEDWSQIEYETRLCKAQPVGKGKGKKAKKARR
ncbi:hypothetical protein B0T16DRAFT_454755 [Cercophora newfieldiana]|uniref:FAD-binding PCMH-type domain-containing protein n=1 Tax=Cercophora newfieldiana TaxID=92897 RepID=A0AA40CX48_9PEZI|nr:hypothetical protein B0T16DRAFT_454755 [Cercophora newfieldiana]